MNNDRPRVKLTCTTTGQMHIETVGALLRVIQDQRFATSMSVYNDRPYASVLNGIVRDLRAGDDFDWWLHTDNDQAWTGNPLDSVAENKSLVGFPAPLYRPGKGGTIICLTAWTIVDPQDYTQVKPTASKGGMTRVDVIGSGAFLMRVDALREFKDKAPFERLFDEDGVQSRGCDVEFCHKWREAGNMIWANFDCLCEHYKVTPLLQVLRDMQTIRAEAAGEQL